MNILLWKSKLSNQHTEVSGLKEPTDMSDFPGGSKGKASASNAGDPGSISGLGRSPGEGNGYLLQYSCQIILWTEIPGGLQSMASQRVGHN